MQAFANPWASASIITEACTGLSPSDATALALHLRNTIINRHQNQLSDHLLYAWHAIEGLSAIQINPSRVKCVMLAWHTLTQALREGGNSNTVF
jgi:nitrogen fixation NifU-like protein